MKEDKDQQILDFDFDPTKCAKTWTPLIPISTLEELYSQRKKETWHERSTRLLSKLRDFCLSCDMCSLGKNYCDEYNTIFDPHVFSNMKPNKFVIVGQNPGHNECLQGEPFVGDAGKFFNEQLQQNGIQRDQLYVTNTCKCHSISNEQPTPEQMSKCEFILRLELAILQPKLIITLGKVAFEALCPEKQMSKCFNQICESKKFRVKVYPVYHPSPRNMQMENRKEQFIKDIKILCRIIKRY